MVHGKNVTFRESSMEKSPSPKRFEEPEGMTDVDLRRLSELSGFSDSSVKKFDPATVRKTLLRILAVFALVGCATTVFILIFRQAPIEKALKNNYNIRNYPSRQEYWKHWNSPSSEYNRDSNEDTKPHTTPKPEDEKFSSNSEGSDFDDYPNNEILSDFLRKEREKFVKSSKNIDPLSKTGNLPSAITEFVSFNLEKLQKCKLEQTVENCCLNIETNKTDLNAGCDVNKIVEEIKKREEDLARYQNRGISDLAKVINGYPLQHSHFSQPQQDLTNLATVLNDQEFPNFEDSIKPSNDFHQFLKAEPWDELHHVGIPDVELEPSERDFPGASSFEKLLKAAPWDIFHPELHVVIPDKKDALEPSETDLNVNPHEFHLRTPNFNFDLFELRLDNSEKDRKALEAFNQIQKNFDPQNNVLIEDLKKIQRGFERNLFRDNTELRGNPNQNLYHVPATEFDPFEILNQAEKQIVRIPEDAEVGPKILLNQQKIEANKDSEKNLDAIDGSDPLKVINPDKIVYSDPFEVFQNMLRNPASADFISSLEESAKKIDPNLHKLWKVAEELKSKVLEGGAVTPKGIPAILNFGLEEKTKNIDSETIAKLNLEDFDELEAMAADEVQKFYSTIFPKEVIDSNIHKSKAHTFQKFDPNLKKRNSHNIGENLLQNLRDYGEYLLLDMPPNQDEFAHIENLSPSHHNRFPILQKVEDALVPGFQKVSGKILTKFHNIEDEIHRMEDKVNPTIEKLKTDLASNMHKVEDHLEPGLEAIRRIPKVVVEKTGAVLDKVKEIGWKHQSKLNVRNADTRNSEKKTDLQQIHSDLNDQKSEIASRNLQLNKEDIKKQFGKDLKTIRTNDDQFEDNIDVPENFRSDRGTNLDSDQEIIEDAEDQSNFERNKRKNTHDEFKKPTKFNSKKHEVDAKNPEIQKFGTPNTHRRNKLEENSDFSQFEGYPLLDKKGNLDEDIWNRIFSKRGNVPPTNGITVQILQRNRNSVSPIIINGNPAAVEDEGNEDIDKHSRNHAETKYTEKNKAKDHVSLDKIPEKSSEASTSDSTTNETTDDNSSEPQDNDTHTKTVQDSSKNEGSSEKTDSKENDPQNKTVEDSAKDEDSSENTNSTEATNSDKETGTEDETTENPEVTDGPEVGSTSKSEDSWPFHTRANILGMNTPKINKHTDVNLVLENTNVNVTYGNNKVKRQIFPHDSPTGIYDGSEQAQMHRPEDLLSSNQHFQRFEQHPSLSANSFNEPQKILHFIDPNFKQNQDMVQPNLSQEGFQARNPNRFQEHRTDFRADLRFVHVNQEHPGTGFDRPNYQKVQENGNVIQGPEVNFGAEIHPENPPNHFQENQSNLGPRNHVQENQAQPENPLGNHFHENIANQNPKNTPGNNVHENHQENPSGYHFQENQPNPGPENHFQVKQANLGLEIPAANNFQENPGFISQDKNANAGSKFLPENQKTLQGNQNVHEENLVSPFHPENQETYTGQQRYDQQYQGYHQSYQNQQQPHPYRHNSQMNIQGPHLSAPQFLQPNYGNDYILRESPADAHHHQQVHHNFEGKEFHLDAENIAWNQQTQQIHSEDTARQHQQSLFSGIENGPMFGMDNVRNQHLKENSDQQKTQHFEENSDQHRILQNHHFEAKSKHFEENVDQQRNLHLQHFEEKQQHSLHNQHVDEKSEQLHNLGKQHFEENFDPQRNLHNQHFEENAEQQYGLPNQHFEENFEQPQILPNQHFEENAGQQQTLPNQHFEENAEQQQTLRNQHFEDREKHPENLEQQQSFPVVGLERNQNLPVEKKPHHPEFSNGNNPEERKFQNVHQETQLGPHSGSENFRLDGKENPVMTSNFDQIPTFGVPEMLPRGDPMSEQTLQSPPFSINLDLPRTNAKNLLGHPNPRVFDVSANGDGRAFQNLDLTSQSEPFPKIFDHSGGNLNGGITGMQNLGHENSEDIMSKTSENSEHLGAPMTPSKNRGDSVVDDDLKPNGEKDAAKIVNQIVTSNKEEVQAMNLEAVLNHVQNPAPSKFDPETMLAKNRDEPKTINQIHRISAEAKMGQFNAASEDIQSSHHSSLNPNFQQQCIPIPPPPLGSSLSLVQQQIPYPYDPNTKYAQLVPINLPKPQANSYVINPQYTYVNPNVPQQGLTGFGTFFANAQQPMMQPAAPTGQYYICNPIAAPNNQVAGIPGVEVRQSDQVLTATLKNNMTTRESDRCASGHELCADNSKCIKTERICDGEVHCDDGSDEVYCSCKYRIGPSRSCDGYFDCPNGEDEVGCFGCEAGFFNCDDWSYSHGSTCIPMQLRCNGEQDCPTGSDERECSVLLDVVETSEDLFKVSNNAGFLHRNFAGKWYPACSNPEIWALEACKYETGPSVIPPLTRMVPVDHQYKAQFVSAEGDRTIRLVNKCVAKRAVYVECPQPTCGIRRVTKNPYRREEIDTSAEEIAARFSPRSKRESKNATVDDGILGNGRVVGGKPCQPGAWPWVVSIYKNGAFHCGGVLISDSWLVTAAHCVEKYWLYFYEIELGMLRRFSFSPMQQTRYATHVVSHPGYDRSNLKNDLAMMRLNHPVKFNRYVRPICLPNEYTAGNYYQNGPVSGTVCTAVGWGATVEHGSDPDHMREVEVPVLPICKHKEDQEGNEICAGLMEGGKDACQGDSGGPFLCRNPNMPEQWYLAGIVSHGEGCARPNEPGVYTKVALYRDWIYENAKDDMLPQRKPLYHCPGYTCRAINKCIPKKRRCDRVIDCLYGDDEIDCERGNSFSSLFKHAMKHMMFSYDDGLSRSNVETPGNPADTIAGSTFKMENSPITDTVNGDGFAKDDSSFASPAPISDRDGFISNAEAATGKTSVDVTTEKEAVDESPEEFISPTGVHKEDATRPAKTNMNSTVMMKPFKGERFLCGKMLEVIPAEKKCDKTIDCQDGTDEESCACADYLRHSHPEAICDGVTDCEDLTDEQDCVSCGGGHFYCRLSKACIPIEKKCDNSPDCDYNEDEWDCFTLADSYRVVLDADARPELLQSGLLAFNRRDEWVPVCMNYTGIEGKIAADACVTLGFSDYEKYLQVEVSNRSLKAGKRKEEIVGEDGAEKGRTCNALYIRCANVSVSGHEIGKEDRLNVASELHTPPWNAAVYADGEYKCAGTVLNLNWILTSVNCFPGILKLHQHYVAALLGTTKGYLGIGGPHEQVGLVVQSVQVSSTEVVLLRLRESLRFTRSVRPLHFKRTGDFIRYKETCMATGTDLNQKSRAVLLKPVQNCTTGFRCFERLDAPPPECKVSDGGDPWSGCVVCDSGSGFYPAGVFHEPRGWCGFSRTVSLANIAPVKRDIFQFMEKTADFIPPPPCNGFRCNLGKCIQTRSMCNGIPDCRDSADENPGNCEEVKRNCHLTDTCFCSPAELKCSNGNCVPKVKFCDQIDDCGDGSDEPDTCNCQAYLRLANVSQVCDGVRNCLDKSDEDPMICKCSAGQFKCGQSSYCIPNDMVCDGQPDCPDNEDEQRCFSLRSPEDNLNIGEVFSCTSGVWHPGCFPEHQTTSELEGICKQIGFTGNSASYLNTTALTILDTINSSTTTTGRPILDTFSSFWVHRGTGSTKVRLSLRSGARDFVQFVDDPECHRLFLRCL